VLTAEVQMRGSSSMAWRGPDVQSSPSSA
jgi:hypothetical protein